MAYRRGAGNGAGRPCHDRIDAIPCCPADERAVVPIGRLVRGGAARPFIEPPVGHQAILGAGQLTVHVRPDVSFGASHVPDPNLVDKTHAPYPTQLLYFLAGLLPTLFITVFAVLRSRRLSDLLDILSDERMPARSKYSAVGNVFRKRR